MKNFLNIKALAASMILITSVTSTAYAYEHHTVSNSDEQVQVLNTEETKDFIALIKEEVAMQGYDINFSNTLPKVTMPAFKDTADTSVYATNDELTEVEVANLNTADLDDELKQLTSYDVHYLDGIDDRSKPLTSEVKQKLIATLVSSLNQDGVTVDFQGNMPKIERSQSN